MIMCFEMLSPLVGHAARISHYIPYKKSDLEACCAVCPPSYSSPPLYPQIARLFRAVLNESQFCSRRLQVAWRLSIGRNLLERSHSRTSTYCLQVSRCQIAVSGYMFVEMLQEVVSASPFHLRLFPLELSIQIHCTSLSINSPVSAYPRLQQTQDNGKTRQG